MFFNTLSYKLIRSFYVIFNTFYRKLQTQILLFSLPERLETKFKLYFWKRMMFYKATNFKQTFELALKPVKTHIINSFFSEESFFLFISDYFFLMQILNLGKMKTVLISTQLNCTQYDHPYVLILKLYSFWRVGKRSINEQ